MTGPLFCREWFNRRPARLKSGPPQLVDLPSLKALVYPEFVEVLETRQGLFEWTAALADLLRAPDLQDGRWEPTREVVRRFRRWA